MNNSDSTKKQLRLQAYLARCGIASRRKCEEYILQGRVTINGVTTKTLGVKVIEDDEVEFDGNPVNPVKNKYYLILHKPSGYLSSNADPFNRPLAVDLINKYISTRLFHVGRLDFLSSGILIFTNDGDFARKIGHPSSNIVKEYLVETRYPVSQEKVTPFLRGIEIDGEIYRIDSFHLVNSKKLHIRLVEGKNREIRRIFDYLTNRVTRIHRIQYGPITLGDLPKGEFRPISKAEMRVLQGGKNDNSD